MMFVKAPICIIKYISSNINVMPNENASLQNCSIKGVGIFCYCKAQLVPQNGPLKHTHNE